MRRMSCTTLLCLVLAGPSLAGRRLTRQIDGLILDYPTKRWLIVDRLEPHLKVSRPRILSQLGLAEALPLTLVFTDNRAEFREVTGFEPEGWVAAQAFPMQRRIVVRTEAGLADLPHTIDHELVHIYLRDALGEAADALPLWMHEGIAKYLAQDWRFDEELLVRDAVLQAKLLRFDDLTGKFPGRPEQVALAYAQSYTLVEFLFTQYGPQTFARFLAEVRASGDAYTALERATGRQLRSLEREWLGVVSSRYRWLALYHNTQNLLWAAMGALAVLAFALVQRRKRRKLEVMDVEQGSQD